MIEIDGISRKKNEKCPLLTTKTTKQHTVPSAMCPSPRIDSTKDPWINRCFFSAWCGPGRDENHFSKDLGFGLGWRAEEDDNMTPWNGWDSTLRTVLHLSTQTGQNRTVTWVPDQTSSCQFLVQCRSSEVSSEQWGEHWVPVQSKTVDKVIPLACSFNSTINSTKTKLVIPSEFLFFWLVKQPTNDVIFNS